MDHISASFGALRVDGVQEFVPAAFRQAQAANATNQQGVVQTGKVAKEFVPGKGLVKEFVPGKGLMESSGLAQQQPQPPRFSTQSYGQSGEPTQSSRLQFERRGFPQQQSQPSVHDEVGQVHGLATGRSSLNTIPKRRTLRSVFLPDDLRSYFAAQARLAVTALEPDDPLIKELPRKFHSMLPLDADPNQRNSAGSTGYPTGVFKAISSKDGFAYAVRRVDNIRPQGNLHQILASWSKVTNPNVVPLRELFSQNKAVFLVHDFLPGAQTLRDFILARGPNALLPENVIWSILTQILSGVRAVHNAGLACRDLSPARVLLTGRFRARLGCAGLIHALEPNSAASSIADQQFEDILWVARLTICLGSMSLQGLTDLQSGAQFMQARYSQDLLAFALHPFKLQMNKQRCSVFDMLALASPALLAENDALYAHGDAMEENLSRMYDSDRMFRLMSKLSLICERPPPPGVKPADSWSETDDRYLIKLFRDYVFHQIDDRGKPVVDFGHVIDCLNKLDAGSPERLLLASRDGRSFLVVSYDDVRVCIDKAFHELFQSSTFHQQQE